MADLAKKSDKDLIKMVEEKRSLISDSRRDIQNNKTEAVVTLRTAKKELARCLTEINARKGKDQ